MPGLAGLCLWSPRGLSVLAKLPLRSKLILVVSIPLFVILGFAGFGISNRLSDLDGQRQYSRLRVPNDALAGLQSTLENEGVLTTWFTATTSDPVVAAKLDRARDTTDRAVASVRAAGTDVGNDAARLGRARRAARHAEVAAAPGRRPRRPPRGLRRALRQSRRRHARRV